MGADRWDVCPQCKRRRGERIRASEEALLQAYGVVPVEEYKAMEANLDNMRQEAPEDLLREDWEISLTDDHFYFRFAAFCYACGWAFDFKHEQPTPVNSGSGPQ